MHENPFRSLVRYDLVLLPILALLPMVSMKPEPKTSTPPFQEVGGCKICSREPGTAEKDFKNEAGCSVSAKWVPDTLSNGSSGECNDSNCEPRNCKWVGQIQVTNHGKFAINVDIKWGAIFLGGGTINVPGNNSTRSVDLNKEIVCDEEDDQTIPVTVSFPSGGCTVPLALDFKCKKCQ
ncbi:MAG TPA: hypothetical protein ENK02_03345 [Planctomycetes bacterium]|nr:hypothetical protein [Planctomycetota bacterium]